jgi:hypothetical protein
VATEKTYPMFSRPMNHDEFVAQLSGETPAAAAAGRGYSA